MQQSANEVNILLQKIGIDKNSEDIMIKVATTIKFNYYLDLNQYLVNLMTPISAFRSTEK